MDDFKALVNKAHESGLLVVLDWVPNHTAWDHTWITEHPEFYMSESAAVEARRTLLNDCERLRNIINGAIGYPPRK